MVISDSSDNIFAPFAKHLLDNKHTAESIAFLKLIEEIDIFSYVPDKFVLFYLSAMNSIHRFGETGKEVQKEVFSSMLIRFEKEHPEYLTSWDGIVSFLESYTTTITTDSALALFKNYLLHQDSIALLSSKLDDLKQDSFVDINNIFPIPLPNIAVKFISNVVDVNQNMEEMYADLIENVEETNAKLLTSGFSSIDDLMPYQMNEGGISVISGRSASGKTTLKLNMMYKQLLSGIPVLSWTPEMGRSMERNTLLSIHTGLPVKYILDYRKADDPAKTYEKLVRGIEDFKSFSYFVHDGFMESAETFVAAFQHLVDEHGIKLVYLDNADNIREVYQQKDAGRKSYIIQSTLRRFEDFANDKNLHVCCTWQLNRGAVDKKSGKVNEKVIESTVSFSDTVNQIVSSHLSVEKKADDSYNGIGDGVTIVRSIKARGGAHQGNTAVMLVRDKFSERLYEKGEVDDVISYTTGSANNISVNTFQTNSLDMTGKAKKEDVVEEGPKENLSYEKIDNDKGDLVIVTPTYEENKNEEEFENDFKKTGMLKDINKYSIDKWKAIRSKHPRIIEKLMKKMLLTYISGGCSLLSLIEILPLDLVFMELFNIEKYEDIYIASIDDDYIDLEKVKEALLILSKGPKHLIADYLKFVKNKYIDVNKNKRFFSLFLNEIEAFGFSIPVTYSEFKEDVVSRDNIIIDSKSSVFGAVYA